MKRDDDRELEMACYGGDDEWDAKFEWLERSYPWLKWVIVAGIIGLAWLVQ